MKQIGMVVKNDAEALQKADELETWLRARQVQVMRCNIGLGPPQMTVHDASIAPADLLAVFVLGGDGTFLSAVRWIGAQGIPVVGVKFGEVGFLAESTRENLFEIAASVLESRFSTNSRLCLRVSVISQEQEVMTHRVLNDMVITKGPLARLASLKSYINDHYLTTYRADGLIVATPTGSTAYSLAAGGPIIHPAVPCMIMTPICPFTLTNRPLIVADTVRIHICPENDAPHMLTLDGQAGFEISARDTIRVVKDEIPVEMINIPGQHYFDVLKSKLRWGGGRV